MSVRNAGLAVFRLIALADANQSHLQGNYGFQYDRAEGLASSWHTSVWLVPGFAMSGFIQIETLSSVRGPFHSRGIACFWLMLVFFRSFFSHIFSFLGLSHGKIGPQVPYSMTSGLSCFFTSHTIMPVATPTYNVSYPPMSISAAKWSWAAALTALTR
jgi:hypothetical protein